MLEAAEAEAEDGAWMTVVAAGDDKSWRCEIPVLTQAAARNATLRRGSFGVAPYTTLVNTFAWLKYDRLLYVRTYAEFQATSEILSFFERASF